MDVDDLVGPITRLLSAPERAISRDGTLEHTFAPKDLARPDGLLPVLLRMAEELWRRDTGVGLFGLVLIQDAKSWSGYRITRIYHASASIVLLAIDAVIEEILEMAGQTTITLAHFNAWIGLHAGSQEKLENHKHST
ncbi:MULTISPECIES: hypothetical protein [Asaia]|uniref:Uncharacterized protein n=1 Tax=Asaia spathodeae TaxID=657016 RepID=A0ABX2P828_9PROT|nr:hypothetical protein [Asaia spathodeae]GBR20197.1 hypothetical protein AA105894_2498 [Asaia spathodeae NBRC 105894]